MNKAAEKHLAKAEDYLGKGEGFYHKAAAEIVVAKESDSTLINREIGERFGRSDTWVRDLLGWHSGRSALRSPWAGEQEQRGGRNVIGARKILRDAPLEQVEQIVSQLPRERQQALAAAAGSAYHKTRVEHDERERNLTHQQRQEREVAADRLTKPARRAAAGFTTLGIVGHLEQATEELRELVADASLTPEHVEQIEAVVKDFLTELEVARGVAEVG